MRRENWLRRTFVLSLTSILAVFLTFSLSTAKEKDILIIGVPSTPAGIDADINAEPVGCDIMANIQDWGISYKYEPSKEPGLEDVMVPNYWEVEPGYIEKWEVAPDYSKATFTLRKGVFSPWGNELTTEDVAWKWERNHHFGNDGKFIQSVINCDGMHNLKIIDKYIFEVIPNAPAALLVTVWQNLWFPVWDSKESKKHATNDDPFANGWVGTHGGAYGPYYITDWKSGQHVILEANPKHWRNPPKFRKIIYKVIPESASRVAMIKDGTIDMAFNLSPREVDSLKNVSGVRVINIKGNWGMQIIPNQQLVEAFKSQEVRQAIQYAIPQEEICKVAFFGQATPWTGATYGQYPAADASLWPYQYSIEKAKELMKKAGWEKGFKTELYYSADFAPHETTAVLIKDSLAKINIQIDLRKTPAGAFNSGIMQKSFPFALFNDLAANPDPFYVFRLLYWSQFYHNFQNHYSDRIDQMIDEGTKMVDREQRYAYAKEVSKVIIEEVPFVWGVEQNYTAVIRNNIDGFNWDITNNVRCDFLYPKN